MRSSSPQALAGKPPRSGPEGHAVRGDLLTSQEHRDDVALGSQPGERGPARLRDHVVVGDGHRRLRIDEHDVGVGSRVQVTLALREAVTACRFQGVPAHGSCQAQTSLRDRVEHQPHRRGEAWSPERSPPDASLGLLGNRRRRVVGGHVRQDPVGQQSPHRRPIVRRAVPCRRCELPERTVPPTSSSSSRRYWGHASAAMRTPPCVCLDEAGDLGRAHVGDRHPRTAAPAASVTARTAPALPRATSTRRAEPGPRAPRPEARLPPRRSTLVLACTRQTPSKLATRSNTDRSVGPSIPGTPWVVQVKTLKNVTPAAHAGSSACNRSGQTCAARPKSTCERPRTDASLSESSAGGPDGMRMGVLHDRGDPARRRGRRTRREVLSFRRSRIHQVDVGVDHARHDEQAGGVDRTSASR